MQLAITIISSIFILFLPGFVISFVFFKKGKIDAIERVALSFALSIAVVPLIVFYGNLLGIPITKMSVIFYVLAIISVTGLIILIRAKRKIS